jgi:hypothetical protein
MRNHPRAMHRAVFPPEAQRGKNSVTTDFTDNMDFFDLSSV